MPRFPHQFVLYTCVLRFVFDRFKDRARIVEELFQSTYPILTQLKVVADPEHGMGSKMICLYLELEVLEPQWRKQFQAKPQQLCLNLKKRLSRKTVQSKSPGLILERVEVEPQGKSRLVAIYLKRDDQIDIHEAIAQTLALLAKAFLIGPESFSEGHFETRRIVLAKEVGNFAQLADEVALPGPRLRHSIEGKIRAKFERIMS